MKTYTVTKQIYNERARRLLEPGELVDFDDTQAEALTAKGCISPVVEPRIIRARRHKYQLEPELDKLTNSDF